MKTKEEEKEVIEAWLKDLWSQFSYMSTKIIHDKAQCWVIYDIYERLRRYYK